MPGLDLSFVLALPFFRDTFDVIRHTKDVDGDGVTVKRDASVRGVSGNVQPASTATLQRLPDGARVQGAIEIWTTFPLTPGVDGQGADEIPWQGATYTVMDIGDWSRYRADAEKPGGWRFYVAQMRDLRPAR